MKKSFNLKNYLFPIMLLGGIIIGSILGILLGEKATILAPVGDIFLNLLFTIVVPMVFVSISSAVGNMVNMKRLGKILGNLILVFVVTGAIAGILVITVVNIFPPAAGSAINFVAAEIKETASIGELVVGSLTVDDFSGLLSKKKYVTYYSILYSVWILC